MGSLNKLFEGNVAPGGFLSEDIFGTTSLGGEEFHYGSPWENLKQGANAQDKFIRGGRDEQLKYIGEAEAFYDPHRADADKQIRRLSEMTDLYDQLVKNPELIRKLPGYQFGLDEARRGVESSAASKGMLLSGRTLQELGDRSQNYQDTFYGNEVGRRLAGVSSGLATANFGAGILDRLAELKLGRGKVGAQYYKNLSDYLKFHENAGMENAQSWMGFLQGMLGGGMGGMGGGGGNKNTGANTQAYGAAGGGTAGGRAGSSYFGDYFD